MKVRVLVGLLLVLLSVAALAARGAVVRAFRTQEQQVLTVTGRIVSSGIIGGACHLYFGHDPKRSLVAVIPAEHRSQFPARPDSRYHNQHVQVSGSIRDKQGRLEIVLNHPDQIALVKPGTPAAAAPPERRSLRLETRMARLEAELKALRQQVARSGGVGTAVPQRSAAVPHLVQAELKAQQQVIQSLARRVRDLETDVDQLARAHIIQRRGSR